jgi:Glycosyl transferase family 2
MAVEFTIIVESYNLTEGQGPSRWLRSLTAARAMAKDGGEVLVADVYGAPEFVEMLAREFPDVRRLDVAGLKYDEAKTAAAAAAQGEFILYLDGDCVPEPGWHTHHIAALRRPGTVAVAGYTRYDPGFYGSVMSVMDFGFLQPRTRRPVKCYAFNNCGFRRQALLVDVPIPAGDLRCHCYRHACLFERRGTPVELVPDARVVHETTAFLPERTRRGYDLVVAAREDPELAEHQWLRAGILSAPLFYASSVVLDWKRTLAGWRTLEMSRWQVPFALALFPLMRLVDLAGIVRAFFIPSTREGWGGTTLGSRRVFTPGRHD